VFRAAPRGAATLADARERLRRAGSERLAAIAQRLGALDQSVRHLNPQAVLERGYSIVTAPDGAIVQDADQVATGQTIGVQFARGEVDARVTRKD
jgi:exodeoxyribonuclease VII large subunit